MKSLHFRWIFVAILCTSFYFLNQDKAVVIGATMESSDGHYYLAGGTSPSALWFSIAIGVVYTALLISAPGETGPPIPGVIRRFASFWIDFVIAMSIIGPLVGAIPTFTEWMRTGVFVWSFERTERFSGDVPIVISCTAFAFLLLATYFALPLMTGRPSPGTTVMGYRVTSDDDEPLQALRAFQRTAFGFLAVCNIFKAFGTQRDPELGKFWLDRKFHTRAVKLK